MRKNLLKSLVAGAVIFAASAGANAFQITLGSDVVTFDSIDWSSGGTVWSPNYSASASVGTSFDLYYMAKAASLNIGSTPVYFLDGTKPAELTIFAHLVESIASDTGLTQTFSLSTGSWSIYQDAAKNSNQGTGVGFADGTKILAGSFNPGSSGSFTAFTLVDGFGVEALIGDVSASPASYVTPHPTGTVSITTLQAGFLTTGWVKPTGFSNGVDGGTDASYNPATQLVLQGDANQSFNVPEPSSMALLGLALAGVGAVRRRK